jgi:hypothetical protein
MAKQEKKYKKLNKKIKASTDLYRKEDTTHAHFVRFKTAAFECAERVYFAIHASEVLLWGGAATGHPLPYTETWAVGEGETIQMAESRLEHALRDLAVKIKDVDAASEFVSTQQPPFLPEWDRRRADLTHLRALITQGKLLLIPTKTTPRGSI